MKYVLRQVLTLARVNIKLFHAFYEVPFLAFAYFFTKKKKHSTSAIKFTPTNTP